MQIIQIGPYPFFPDCIHGGVESSVYGLVLELAKSHTVDVFDFPRIGCKDSVEKQGSLTIHRYSNPGTHNQDATRRVSEMVRDIVAIGPEACHIHGTGAISNLLYFALQNYGFPVMVTVHGLLHEEKKQALMRKPSLKHLYQFIVQSRDERELLNAVPRVIVDTVYVEKMLLAYNLRHAPEIHVIPQGINSRYYELKCSADSNVILSVGAIGERKGYLYTLRAFEKLRESGVDAKWEICGIVSEQAYYQKLLDAIRASKYSKDIMLHINASQQELFDAYQRAHIFALHSQEESQGIVFAEAMACGLPVVTTNIGGIPYVVKNGESGLLGPFADSDAMAENMRRLMMDDNLWKSMSAKAKIVAKDYDWSVITKNILNRY